jgi:hypothetical protein
MQRRQRAEFANAGCRILITAESKNSRAARKQLSQPHVVAVLIGKAEVGGLRSRSDGARAKTRHIGVIGRAKAPGR